MIIITDYKLIFKRDNDILVESNVTSICPICKKPLVYRDSCLRHMKHEGGERSNILIRRLKCTYCKTLHRELPDCFVPYKHYSAEVISGTLEGIVSPADIDSEDYPCVTTQHRWCEWLVLNTNRINGYLKSVAYQVLGFSEELLKSSVSLLKKLRSSNHRWLETILQFIYNSGGYLVTD